LAKKAQIANENNNSSEANLMLQHNNAQSENCAEYHIVYGDVLTKNKDYTHAVGQYVTAQSFTSDPLIYFKAAYCYEQSGLYRNAERAYLVACDIEPNKLAPRSALMSLYLDKLKDTSNAILMAKEIIALIPKLRTKQSDFYQYQAYSVLKRLGIKTTNPHRITNGFVTLKYN